MDKSEKMLSIASAIFGPDRVRNGGVVAYPFEWRKVCEVAGHTACKSVFIEGEEVYECVRCNYMWTKADVMDGTILLNSSFNNRS